MRQDEALKVQRRILTLASRIHKDNLPLWMEPLLNDDLINSLYSSFVAIEAEQEERIQAAYESNQINHPFRFSSANSDENSYKNRYQDIIPYDYNRVVLKQSNNDTTNNYINASVIMGLPGSEEFIVSQGPLPSTQNDFWQMNWENDVTIILMLTKEKENGRIKCHRYWPTIEESIIIPNIDKMVLKVSLLEEKELINNLVIKRTLSLQLYNNDDVNYVKPILTRCIIQLHYLQWADYKDCDTEVILKIVDLIDSLLKDSRGDGLLSHLNGLIDYSEKDKNTIIAALDRDNRKRNPNGTFDEPVNITDEEVKWIYEKDSKINFTNARSVIHCSAGCGRSGTFCTIDIVLLLLNKLDNPGKIDLIRLTVRKLREQRKLMVQSFEQFVLIYEVILLRIYQWQAELVSNSPNWIKKTISLN